MRLAERIERLTPEVLNTLTRARVMGIRRRLAEEPSNVTDDERDFLATDVGWRAYLAPETIAGDEWAVYVRRVMEGDDRGAADIEAEAERAARMPHADRVRFIRAIATDAKQGGCTRDTVTREREQWQRRIFTPR